MPSTLFHIAVGILIGFALLGDRVDRNVVAVIAFAAALPDLDSFLSLWYPGAHRAYLHNVFVFLVPAAVLFMVSVSRARSVIKEHWEDGIRVLWVAVLVIAVAGVGLDLFGSGVNLFYPVNDQFYHFSGNVMYSNQDGFQQTLFDMESARIGDSKNLYYVTGLDPAPGPDPAGSERVFMFFGNGIQLLLSVTALIAVGYRLRQRRFFRIDQSFSDLVPRQTLRFGTVSQTSSSQEP